MSVAPGEPRPSVVLVDDSPEVRAVVRMLLQSSGFDVVGEGADGDEAIVLAHRHQPDLLLLDASMPGVDGLEALPAVLALSPHTQVVMFTGFEEGGLAAHARELGAADLVEKSLDLDALPDRLRRVLRARRTLTAVADPATEPDRQSAEPGLLSEHVQQFRELFDRAEIGMATMTSSGTIVRANRALAGLMSCAPEDLVGVDYGRLTVGGGDDLDRCLDDICTLGSDLATFEHLLPAAADESPPRTASVTLAPIRDARHQVLYVFAQVQDVTSRRMIESDLRHSQELFRRLVTAVSEYAIFMLDVHGTVVSWNAGAQRIKGYRAQEIVGRHFRVFYPADEQASGHPERNLEDALRTGSHVEEGWRIRRDGSRFWARIALTALYDDDGAHVGFAKVTRDGSEQREREEERRSFLDQRTQLLAMTAHELRNPTAAIAGSAGVLLKEWERLTEDERTELLTSIRTSATRLRRLATDLTHASQSESELLPFQFGQVSLTDTVQSAVARIHSAEPDVVLEVDVPREVVFSADAGRLGQAVDNLLENAFRHGTPPIGLVATTNDVIHIRVTDAGQGVDPELHERLFQRAATGSVTGTGLGLYLVREIARRHGGDATYLPPTDERPATFEITLPRDPVPST